MSVLDRRSLLLAGAAAMAGCASRPALGPLAREQWPPEPAREMRGAWVASVANIDWPSAPGLPASEQRAQAERIVARAAALGLNALLLQVRPACDALYTSALEPASEYVSGIQGVAAHHDPLALWLEAAHARGLELHAWFNPFRARHPSAQSALSPHHVALRRPDWVRRYADLLWLDPGEPGAAAHTLNVIEDVVRRYDVDGVHLDDYFYPYPAGGAPFPDDDSYARSGSTRARDDWRRDNVDRFVRALVERVRAVKPALKIGISPFALPRKDRRPAGIEGFDPHARLYADAERWCAEGWLDIVSPQLYWPMAQRAQAFDVLLDHWAATNARQRHLWPGLFTSRVGLAPDPWPAEEIERQLAHLRSEGAKAGGHLHFSMVALMDDRGGLASRLLAAAPAPALVPASPWLGAAPARAPRVSLQAHALEIAAADGATRWIVVQQRRAGRWHTSTHFAARPLALPRTGEHGAVLDAVVVQGLNAAGSGGERVAHAAAWPSWT